MPPLSRAGKHETCTRRWNWCQARETRNWNATRRKGIQCQALENVPKLSVDWTLFWLSVYTLKERHEFSQIKPSQAKTKLENNHDSRKRFSLTICVLLAFYFGSQYNFRTRFISFRIKISDTLQKHSLIRCTPRKGWHNIGENGSFTAVSWLWVHQLENCYVSQIAFQQSLLCGRLKMLDSFIFGLCPKLKLSEIFCKWFMCSFSEFVSSATKSPPTRTLWILFCALS